MATRPKVKTLTNTSVDVLNVIRNNASQNYKDYVPKATADAEASGQSVVLLWTTRHYRMNF